MVGRLLTWAAIKEFVYAGNATFTLRSMKTGMRYTYKVKIKKADREAKLTDPAYFVSLLRGADNENDYAYMGVLRRDHSFRLTQASRMKRDAASVVSFEWFVDKMKHERDVLGGHTSMPGGGGAVVAREALMEFWHVGSCGRCGRTLTVPDSVASGIGPVCEGRDL